MVFWLRLGDPFVCQNPRGVCLSRSPRQILGCAYTKYSYGQASISCTILSGSPNPPRRALSYTLSVLIYCIRFIVSSLLPYNLHLQFCCVLSILALIKLVLMALFYAAIRRDLVSLFRSPFLSLDHVFSCELLHISRFNTSIFRLFSFLFWLLSCWPSCS